jgi:hypothetical protein
MGAFIDTSSGIDKVHRGQARWPAIAAQTEHEFAPIPGPDEADEERGAGTLNDGEAKL